MTNDEELVQVDHYLDTLLASRFGIREAEEPEVEDGIRAAALAVRHALPRFHPSFAFEERLAHRLRSAAPPSPGLVIAFLPRPPVTTTDGAPAADRRGRGVLLGGAIASGVSIAGVSIAGAALLVRRRGKPTASVL